MKLSFYMAPLEGITGYSYRNMIHKYFGQGIDKYFTPFFAPHTKRSMNTKEMRDVLPENNRGLYLVPQILTNSSRDFLRFEGDMRDRFGYVETNINLGCPSGTVYSKGRGAGMLRDVEALGAFLEEVFEKKRGEVSLKVRLGCEEPEEFYGLLDVFNRYELKELIIHSRVREEFYKGECHGEIFGYALEHSRNPLCWSGDIVSEESLQKRLVSLKIKGYECSREEGFISIEEGPLKAIMIGRGMVADPSLIRHITGNGPKMSRDELKGFMKEFEKELLGLFGNPVPVLHKLKEIWNFCIYALPAEDMSEADREGLRKQILKCRRIEEYDSLLQVIFSR